MNVAETIFVNVVSGFILFLIYDYMKRRRKRR